VERTPFYKRKKTHFALGDIFVVYNYFTATRLINWQKFKCDYSFKFFSLRSSLYGSFWTISKSKCFFETWSTVHLYGLHCGFVCENHWGEGY